MSEQSHYPHEIPQEETNALASKAEALFMLTNFVSADIMERPDGSQSELKRFELDSDNIPEDSELRRLGIEAVDATYEPGTTIGDTEIPTLVTVFAKYIGKDPNVDPHTFYFLSLPERGDNQIAVVDTTSETGELSPASARDGLELRSILSAVHKLAGGQSEEL